MDVDRIGFGNYDFRIENDKIIVGGCDCEETMDDKAALEIFMSLGNYLYAKKLVNADYSSI